MSFDLLQDGPHGIRIGDADDVLVNNYSGDIAVIAIVKEKLTISEIPQSVPVPVEPEAQDKSLTANPQTVIAAQNWQGGNTVCGLVVLSTAVAAGVWRHWRQNAG